jgi:hypothetical protein
MILVVALALRLTGAFSANLIFDERAHWALAQTIDLRPGHLHLVSRTLDHPLLSIYVLRLGSLLFGTSDFALRLPYVLAGTATLVPVYLLGRRAFSNRAGLLAAALLAVDQFHAGWSRVFMPEPLVLLLVALGLLQFLRVLEHGVPEGRIANPSYGQFVVLGVLLGLAYLAKEPGILLTVSLWIYLLVTPAHRRLLTDPRWYLAHAVMLLVVAPDLVWNLSQWSESYLHRDLALATDSLQVQLKPVSLYLGEWLRGCWDRDAFGDDYEQGNLYVCSAVAGIIYLAGLVAALPQAASQFMWPIGPRRVGATGILPVSGAEQVANLPDTRQVGNLPHGTGETPVAPTSTGETPVAPTSTGETPVAPTQAVRCLVVLFLVVVGVFTILPGGTRFDPFWWPSISLIPAVVCAGGAIDRLKAAGTGYRRAALVGVPSARFLSDAAAVLLLLGLGVRTFVLLRNPGQYEPRATVQQFTDDFLQKGREALRRHDLGEAQYRFIYALNIGGPNTEAQAGLAQIAQERNGH